jgi:hypothetical protein
VIGRRGPLADRNFRLLLAARSISYFGTYLATIGSGTALLVLLVPDVRDFRLGAPQHAEVPALAVAT